MEGDRQPPAAASASVSKVLDDDDLLIEILLRVGFPTTLIHAALVCKHWLRHVSNPKFLHRFCKLHPPRVLGFYINTGLLMQTLSFIPMLPQPPELTAIIRRASFSLYHGQKIEVLISDCWKGRVFITLMSDRWDGSGLTHGVYNPLFPKRGMSIIPPFPRYQRQDDYYCSFWHVISVKEGNEFSYLYVLVESKYGKGKSMVHVYMLRPGASCWRKHLTLATDPLYNHQDRKVVLIDNKIYMPCFPSGIVVLDLMAWSSSTILLPQGVEYGDRDSMLSRADDASGVYLVQAKELQIRIHNGDDWLMVETISLVEMWDNLRMSDCTDVEEKTDVLRIKHVGDNVEFVFLQMGRYVLYLDLKSRTLRKVFEIPNKDEGFSSYIYPFKMIWPPTFPPLKDDPSRNTM